MSDLFIHDRQHCLAPVASADRDALVACFGRVAESSEELEHQAGRFLAWLRDAHRWLSCRCHPAMPEPWPLLAPRQRDGVLHVFRLPTSVPHHASCPFYRDPASDDETGSPSVFRVGLKPMSEGWLTLRMPGQGKLVADPDGEERARSVSRADAGHGLNRVLFSILDRLDYTRLAPTAVKVARNRPPTWADITPYSHLDRLQSLELASGIGFDAVGTTFLPSVPGLLRRLPEQGALFTGRRPQGVFVGQIQDIARDGHSASLIWRGTLNHADRRVVIPVHGTVRRFGGARVGGGPYWCAAALGQRPGESVFRVLDAYIHPVFSKAILLPVDSDAERDTARILIEQIAFWHQAERIGMTVHLRKPLFEELTPSGDSCRPDFILELPNNTRILVETMKGDPAYLAAKVALHSRMRALRNVVALVEHMPGIGDDAFRRALTHLVMQSRRAMAGANA